MLVGAHLMLFTRDVGSTRRFLADALNLPAVDAGGGWLIFALPPAELAVHLSGEERHELYLMCDDLEAAMARLTAAGATFEPAHEERWGRVTMMTIPGGARLSLYQPSHPSPVHPA